MSDEFAIYLEKPWNDLYELHELRYHNEEQGFSGGVLLVADASFDPEPESSAKKAVLAALIFNNIQRYGAYGHTEEALREAAALMPIERLSFVLETAERIRYLDQRSDGLLEMPPALRDMATHCLGHALSIVGSIAEVQKLIDSEVANALHCRKLARGYAYWGHRDD